MNDNKKHPLWDETEALFKRLGWRWPQCKQCRSINPHKAITNLNWFARFEVSLREAEVEIKRTELKVVK